MQQQSRVAWGTTLNVLDDVQHETMTMTATVPCAPPSHRVTRAITGPKFVMTNESSREQMCSRHVRSGAAGPALGRARSRAAGSGRAWSQTALAEVRGWATSRQCQRPSSCCSAFRLSRPRRMPPPRPSQVTYEITRGCHRATCA